MIGCSCSSLLRPQEKETHWKPKQLWFPMLRCFAEMNHVVLLLHVFLKSPACWELRSSSCCDPAGGRIYLQHSLNGIHWPSVQIDFPIWDPIRMLCQNQSCCFLS